MANRVLSKNVIIEMLISGIYYPVFCGKTMEFVQSQELIEVTSINSGVAREYEAGMTTGTLNISGVTILNNTGGRIAITYLIQESIRRAAQTMRIRMIDDDGTALQILFSAIITSNTLSRSFGSYSQSTTTMTITGEPTLSSIVPPPGVICPELPLYIDATPGAIFVHHSALEAAGVRILAVDRTGTGQDPTTGTPGAGTREFKFVGGTGNGTITFDATNPFNTSEVVYVLYKIV